MNNKNKIDTCVDRVIELAGSTTAERELKMVCIKDVIKGYTTDALNLFKNIMDYIP